MDSKKNEPIFGHTEKFLQETGTFQKIVSAGRAWKRITDGNHLESTKYYNFLIGKLLRNITEKKSVVSRISLALTGAFFKTISPNSKQIKGHLEENAKRIETLDFNGLDHNELIIVLHILPKKLDQVHTLNLNQCGIKSEQFRYILNIAKNIRKLHLAQNSSLSAGDLLLIPKHLNHLQTLDLQGFKQISIPFLHKISSLRLKAINFRLCSKITDSGLNYIFEANREKLRFCNLIACPIQDETLYNLRNKCRLVTDLFLGLNPNFSRQAIMDMLLFMKQLEFLHLTSINNMEDSHLEELDLPHLIHLNVFGCDKVTIQGVTKVLTKHQHLRDCILSLPKKEIEQLKHQFPLVNFNFNNSLQSW